MKLFNAIECDVQYIQGVGSGESQFLFVDTVEDKVTSTSIKLSEFQ